MDKELTKRLTCFQTDWRPEGEGMGIHCGNFSIQLGWLRSAGQSASRPRLITLEHSRSESCQICAQHLSLTVGTSRHRI